MSPALNGSSVLRHFKGNNMIEIHDRITFDFYTGLPHMQFLSIVYRTTTSWYPPTPRTSQNSLTIDLVYTPSLPKIV